MSVDVEECRVPDGRAPPETRDVHPCDRVFSREAFAPLALGTAIGGRYRLRRLIGSGGMGHVFEAEDACLGRRVAIKALREDARARGIAKERLVREARLAACVQHPNIVRVYEFGSDGVDYVVMELLHGEDLQARIRRCGQLPIDLVLRTGLCLTSALIAMHEAGIVHRDLKPGNLFLAREGDEEDLLKVLDFGVAKGAPEPGIETGPVFGTLHYMAPEQLRGAKQADPQSDIWSAGAVLYEALTGRPPFDADSVADLVANIASGAPAPIERLRSDVPAHLASAVRRALSQDPAMRFCTARAFHAALLAEQQPVSAHTQPWSVGALFGEQHAGAHRPKLRAVSQAHKGHLVPVLALLTSLLLVSGAIRWLVSDSTSVRHEQPEAGLDCYGHPRPTCAHFDRHVARKSSD